MTQQTKSPYTRHSKRNPAHSYAAPKPDGADWRDVVRALLEVVEDVRRIAPEAVRLVEGEERER